VKFILVAPIQNYKVARVLASIRSPRIKDQEKVKSGPSDLIGERSTVGKHFENRDSRGL
jgi:hypothetical protein